MTFVRSPGSEQIAQFTVPNKGTYRSIAANLLPPDSLYDSLNVFIRRGKLRTRPGLLLLNSTVFNNPVIGGSMAVDGNQKILLGITKDALYKLPFGSSMWSIDTSIVLAYDNDATPDITFVNIGGQVVGLIANDGFILKRWINGQGVSAVSATTGITPLPKSVCISSRRVVALISPDTIRWTQVLSYTDWPADAVVRISQISDVGICVKPLSILAFILYKERSIYLVRSQAGPDETAFHFSEPFIVEGPAGVHSVVNVGGRHFYMTKNGRIASFDGVNYPQWIADGLWVFLQGDIDPFYAYKIFGVYDYRLNTVTFWYPRNGSEGLLTGMVVINLPLQGVGVSDIGSFLGLSSKPCSFAYEMRFDDRIDRSLIFTSTVGDAQSFVFDEDTPSDDGTVFNCIAQTPLFPIPGGMHYDISIEPFLEQGLNNGSVNVFTVTSDSLESESGAVDQASKQLIDLNNTVVQQYLGFNKPTRFFGLRYQWSSTSNVRYSGTVIYGKARS